MFQALVNEYAARHQVRVFTAADSTRSWIRGRFRGAELRISVNRYPLIPVGKGVAYLRSSMPMNLRGWLDLRHDITSWNPEVAHVHGYGHLFVDLGVRLLMAQRIPYVFTCHGIPTRPFRQNVMARTTFRIYQRIAASNSVLNAQVVTAVSKSAAAALIHRNPIQIIPNGLSALPSSDLRKADLLRTKLGLSASVSVVAAAGRLSIEKGFDVLVNALDQVRVEQVACVIAGSDAGEGARLARLAEKCRPGVSVLFPGRLDSRGIADLFAIADVVVVPSREESFGLVALEALAAEKRLVATNAGGLGDFLDPHLAHLVSRDNARELSDAISGCLELGPVTEEERKQFQTFVAQFSWSAIAQRYEVLLSAVASKHRSNGD